MSHYHDPETHQDGAFLQDGCQECESRSRDGLSGLLRFDTERAPLFWQKMVNVERGDDEHYDSTCDARLARELYYFALFLERNTEIDPWVPLQALGKVTRIEPRRSHI